MDWNTYRNKILAELDYEAFFRSELTNIQSRGTEWKASCPFAYLHDGGADTNPSFTVNISKGTYYCNVCHSKGNVHTMFKTIYNLTSDQAWFKLGDELGIQRPDSTRPTRPDIEVGLVSHYHKALMQLTGPIRDVLRERRGYTDSTLRRFQIGWDGQRITIPIYDEFNRLVNFRLYKWNSYEDNYKVTNYEDEHGNSYGELRIFGIENLIDDSVEEIIWCEGETDRILSEQHGFPTACPTSGAGSWRPEWVNFFKNKKKVYIAQDNDKAGADATAKICDKLYSVVDVYVIQWPEDFPNKGDITDFYTKCGQTTADFKRLMDNAVKYEGTTEVIVDEDKDAIDVPLYDSSKAQYYGKRINVPVMISGKDQAPYICPKVINVFCGDSANSDDKKCLSCTLSTYAGDYKKVMTSKDKDIMKLIKCTEKQQEAVIKEMIGIDKHCPKCQINITEYTNIEEVRMIPKAEANFSFSKESEYVVRSGYIITDKNVRANKRYTLGGYMYPDPMTQYASYVFDKTTPDKDLISEFEVSEETMEALKVFQVREGQSVEDKFNEIHRDLERNVTNVWERRDVAIAADLVYHSVLNFYFQEQFVRRGWCEALIIGDSGQAKSTLIERLMTHYGLGEMISGESSKRTGLVYSFQQTNKRWFLVWGAFPLNDGGLLTIDELSGLSEDDLGLMSDVRSSGVARATGVITAETNSRTRAIYISNPRNGKQLNTETYGVHAVLKLFGKAEDVRRLDIAMAVASGDVDPHLVNKKVSDMPNVKHVYTSELCRLCVLWAWSRRPEDIEFDPDAVNAILDKAIYLGKKYHSSIPIVEAADQRLKIARLAVSVACRLYSTTNGTNVVVKKEHVENAVNFLERVFSSKSFGYDKYSETMNTNSDNSDDNLTRLRKKFLLLPLHDFNSMVKILYQLTYFNRSTLEDYTGLSRDDLKCLLKFLTNEYIVERVRGDYRRYPLGTAFLEELIKHPITKEEVSEVRNAHYSDEEF